MGTNTIPNEFSHLVGEKGIPWQDILKAMSTVDFDNETSRFISFTDHVIALAMAENKGFRKNTKLIRFGMEAALVRGQLDLALDVSQDSEAPEILSLKAMIFFVLANNNKLEMVSKKLEYLISQESTVENQIRMSTVKVLLNAARKNPEVISCIMEFDTLLETYPRQLENPLIETLFTLYVVSSLLRNVGEFKKSDLIADILERMGRSKGHRMILALVENLRGTIKATMGEFEQAEAHYKAFFDISKEIDFKLGQGMAYNNLGEMKLNTLQLEDALNYFSMSCELMSIDVGKLTALTNLGHLEMHLGRLDTARKHLTEALEIDDRIDANMIEAHIYFSLLHCKEGTMDAARRILDNVSERIAYTELPIQIALYQLAEGVWNALSGNTEDAMNIFEKAIRIGTENNLFEVIVRAKLELARLFLNQHLKSNQYEYLSNSTYHLDDVIQIAKEQNLNLLYAETLILRSDILGLGNSIIKAKEEIALALDYLETIEPILEAESIQEKARLRQTNLNESGELIIESDEIEKSMDRMTSYKSTGHLREIPFPKLYALLVVDIEKKKLQYSFEFTTENSVGSGFLENVVKLVITLLENQISAIDSLRSISHDEYVLMIERRKSSVCILISSEETFETRYRLCDFLKQFETIVLPPGSHLFGSMVSRDADILTQKYFGYSIEKN